MSSLDRFTEALDGVRASIASGRLAHAHLIVGSPQGDGRAFAEAVLSLLFCSMPEKPCGSCPQCKLVAKHEHPDIVWIEPESKGRQIVIDEQIRPLIQKIAQTSYGGGWKACVILHADRMNPAASNAFLKTLEEPSGKSLLLLVTDVPQAMLPTIVSRCQRINISAGHAIPDGPWREPLLELLRRPLPASSLERLAWSGQLLAILEKEKQNLISGDDKESDSEEDDSEGESLKENSDEFDDEGPTKEAQEARIQAQVNKLRTGMMQMIQLWRRDVLLFILLGKDAPLHFPDEAEHIQRQATASTYERLLADLREVETMSRLLERNVAPKSVFDAGMLAVRTR